MSRVLKDKLIDWVIRHHEQKLVMGLLTFTQPEWFVHSILKRNLHKTALWGKRAGLTLSFDCDYEEDVAAFPQLITILNDYHYKASFACVGNWIERFPNEHLKLLENGHEIVNHTYSHPDNEILNPGRKFKTLPAAEKMQEIELCHEVCRKLLQYEPIGCRIPHFRNLFSPEIYGLLEQAQYRYSSSTWLTNTTSAGLPFKATDTIWEFPLSTCPKHPFTVFDTWHSFRSPHWAYRWVHRTEPEYLHLFRELIDWGIETGSYINIYLDPLDVPGMKNFSSIFDYIAKKEADLCVLRYEDLIQQLDQK